MKKYYTYAFLREDGTPYYIGKGSGKRAYRNGTNKVLILKYFDLEFDAYKHEMYMIHVFGRKDLGTGILHNRTDGGDGASTRIKTNFAMKRHKEVGKRCFEEKLGIHSIDEKTMKQHRLKGSKASQISCARNFKVRYKDGTIFEGTNVSQFCRDRGIHRPSFTTMLNGKSPSACGYQLV